MNGFQGDFLRGALDVAPEGVVICEAAGDRLVVYVNPAFCRLSGYDVAELVGKNLRVLQGDDREQPELVLLRDALRHAEPVRSLLRNVRKAAVAILKLNLEFFPQSIPTLTNLANVSVAMGDTAGAVAAINQALAVQPDNNQLKNLLQRIKAPGS